LNNSAVPPSGGIYSPDSDESAMTKLSAPALVVPQLAGKRFAVVGCNTGEVARIAAALETAKAFSGPVQLKSSVLSPAIFEPYDAIILRIIPTSGCAYVSQSELMEKCRKPIVLIGSRNELIGQLATLRDLTDCKQDFLVDPWDANDLLLRSFLVIRGAATATGGAKAGNDGKRVIIADDDAAIRTMVSTILRNSEIRCEVARDGVEALALAHKLAPHVAILDISMPRMDGFEVLVKLKADPAIRDARVMMLSARQHETDVVRGFALGAEDYVTKPFSPMELVARVRRALRTAL
jgi:CheY-like chemotaxis protein